MHATPCVPTPGQEHFRNREQHEKGQQKKENRNHRPTPEYDSVTLSYSRRAGLCSPELKPLKKSTAACGRTVAMPGGEERTFLGKNEHCIQALRSSQRVDGLRDRLSYR